MTVYGLRRSALVPLVILACFPTVAIADAPLYPELVNKTLLDFRSTVSLELDNGFLVIGGRIAERTTTGETIASLSVDVSFLDDKSRPLLRKTLTESAMKPGYIFRIPVAGADSRIDVGSVKMILFANLKIDTFEARRKAAITAKRWPPDVVAAALAGRAILGMTGEQVTLAIGRPYRIDRTERPDGVREVWNYGGDWIELHNNRVTAIHTRR